MKFKRLVCALLLIIMTVTLCTSTVQAASKVPASPSISSSNVSTSGMVRLAWKAVSGAAKYRIYCSTDRNGTYKRIAEIKGTEYVHKSAEVGQTYYYCATAVSKEGKVSEASKAVVAVRKPAQPVVTVANASGGSLKISWKAVSGTKAYVIVRSTDNKSWSILKTTTETSYTDTSTKLGTTYYYSIRAFASNITVYSVFSEVKSATSKINKPSVSLSTASNGNPKITWKAVENAKSYKVLRSTDNKKWTTIKTTTGTSFTDTTVKKGNIYYYSVQAVAENSAANSPYSKVLSKAIKLSAPSASISSSGGNVVVSWKAVSGAKSYKVYRSTDNKNWKNVATTSSTKYTDKSTKAGNVYYYRVQAVASASAANSTYSKTVSKALKLSTPSLSVSLASTGKIKLTWKAVSGAKGYKVYRSTNKKNWSHIKTVTGTSYTDSSTKAGTTYYYCIKAVASVPDVSSGYSKTVSQTSKLAAPSVSVSTTSNGKIKLTWKAVSGAKSYKIYRSADNKKWTEIKTVTGTSYTDTSVKSGKTYYYRVRTIASKESLNSLVSATKSGTGKLAQPSLKVSNVSSGKVKLSWKAVSGAKGYKIYRSTDNKKWTEIKTVTGTSYTASLVKDKAVTYYRIKAIASNSSANSAYSNTVSKTMKLATPVITLSNTSAGKIKISWKKVSGAKGYKVYRSTDNKKWTVIKTTDKTSYVDTAAKSGTTYYYSVRAIASNSSMDSYHAKIKSIVCKLPAPSVTVSNIANGKIKLTWKAVSGAKSYNISRSTDKKNWKVIKTVTGTSYTDSSVKTGTTYYYRLQTVAKKTALTSVYSATKSGIGKLAQPSISISSPSNGKVKVAWKAVSGAKSYTVYRSSDNKKWKAIKTVSGTSYTDTPPKDHVLYYYRVQAIGSKSAVNSAVSKTLSQTLKLATPVMTIANTTDGKIKITWKKVSGAKSYKVYRSTDNKKWSTLKVTTSTSHVDSTAKTGTKYYYSVRALASNSKADSAHATIKSIVCKLPAPSMTLTNLENGKIKITWNKVSGAKSYNISRSTDKKNWKVVKNTTGTSFTDTSVKSGTTYYYRMQTVSSKSAQTSIYSAVKSKVCKLTKPSITVSKPSGGQVKITWKAVSSAKSYTVYRSTDNKTWKTIKTVTATSYVTAAPKAGITYYYRLKANSSKSGADSAYSDVKSVLTVLKTPTVTVSRNSNNGKVLLKWAKLENAVSYKVYRSTSKDSGYSHVWTVRGSSYTDTTGSLGKTYYYRVIAVASNTKANSAASAAKSGSSTYASDLVLGTTVNASGKPHLYWGQLKSASRYVIQRSMYKTVGFSNYAVTDKTYYNDTGAIEGVEYFYKVYALDSSGSVVDSTKIVSETTALDGEETLVPRYVNVEKIKLRKQPDGKAKFTNIRYMETLKFGKAIIKKSDGSWYRVFYNGKLYYYFLQNGSTTITSKKSTFKYTGSNPVQQHLLDVAVKISQNTETVYQAGGNGDDMGNGALGFDCSGLVAYIINTAMQKYVPVYRISGSLTRMSETTTIYNDGFAGKFTAQSVSLENLQPGDVLYFRSQLDESDSTEIGHCGIYLGNNEFVHCTSIWKDSVCIIPLKGIFRNNLLQIKRFIPASVTPANEKLTVYGPYKYYKVYSEKTAQSDAVAKVKRNDKITLLFTDNNSWAYVETKNGVKGFLQLKYIY